jgi:hypothetical protein
LVADNRKTLERLQDEAARASGAVLAAEAAVAAAIATAEATTSVQESALGAAEAAEAALTRAEDARASAQTSEAEARVEVLRTLGGQLTLSEAAPPEVDAPEERTRWLADRLLASLVREDTPLVTINAGDAAHATRIAEAYGVASDCIVRLCGALERGVPVALTGLDWPRRADLVRDVAALVFGCGALPIPNDETSVWLPWRED